MGSGICFLMAVFNISAICLICTLELPRFRIPPKCIRQLISEPVMYSALCRMWSATLSLPIFTETASSLTQKVPPKPQHSSVRSRSISSRPFTFSKALPVWRMALHSIPTFAKDKVRAARGNPGASLHGTETQPQWSQSLICR
jgi:hypothetical protein